MRRLGVLALLAILSACESTPPPVARYTFPPQVADSDGYYKFTNHWFKGSLQNNLPHGQGHCRTRYMGADGKAQWLEGPCEFNAGVRVDALHEQRAAQSIAYANAQRQDELRDERRQNARREANEAEQRRAREASARATEAAFARALASTQAQVAANQQAEHQRRLEMQRRQLALQASARQEAERREAATAPAPRKAPSAPPAPPPSRAGAGSNSTSDAAQRDRERAEQQQQQQQQRADAERQRREAEARREQERQAAVARREQEQRDAELAKQRKAEEDARARTAFLRTITSGTRFAARTCPGGEGHYYVVGTRPRPKPELVACVNVSYRAQCRGGGPVVTGIANNFVGMSTSCFAGDTYRMSSKLPCEPEDIVVQATDTRSC